jgi:hypothetical protein
LFICTKVFDNARIKDFFVSQRYLNNLVVNMNRESGKNGVAQLLVLDFRGRVPT